MLFVGECFTFLVTGAISLVVVWLIGWLLLPSEPQQPSRSRVLLGVRKWPGSTSQQLADKMGMDRYEVARRLSDLHAEAWVHKGKKQGRYETWFPYR